MANTNRSETARRNRNSARNAGGMYVEGNAVRRLAQESKPYNLPQKKAAAQRMAEQRKRSSVSPERKTQSVSREAQKNRERAMGMGKGYVLFIAAVSVAILFFCIHYLQLKAQITASMKNVAMLESELSQLREDNDAYYSQVTSNVDLNAVRKIAIGRLNMKYPSEDQVMTYTTEGNSYVRQYQDIPNTK